MAYRVAIASSDGIVVNQHFGHAERFHIMELIPESGQYQFLETRNVQPCCQCQQHEESSFDAVLRTLQDVQAILVSKIGNGAADYLEQKGMIVYQAPFPIVPLLEKIIKERLWEVDQWQSPTKN